MLWKCNIIVEESCALVHQPHVSTRAVARYASVQTSTQLGWLQTFKLWIHLIAMSEVDTNLHDMKCEDAHLFIDSESVSTCMRALVFVY